MVLAHLERQRSPLRRVFTSTVAVAHTGNTDETALATFTIPGGILGPNGYIVIRYIISHTNGADDKVLRVRLNGITGTIFSQNTRTTSATSMLTTWIKNRNSQSAQVGTTTTTDESVNTSTESPVEDTVDTSAPFTVVISGQLENGDDTVTLEAATVEAYYGE